MNTKALILVLSACAISAAHAEDIKVTTGNLGGNVVWVLNDHNSSTNDEHHSFAGQLKLQLKGGQSYTGYCVDAKHVALSGYNQFQALTTEDLHTFDPAAAGKIGFLLDSVAPTISTDKEAMAMQLAIWDLLYDATPNQVGNTSGRGDFYIKSIDGLNATDTQAVVNQANTYAATHGSATAIYFQACGPDKNQSFATGVPEPASLASIGLGLAAVLRRKKKKNS